MRMIEKICESSVVIFRRTMRTMPGEAARIVVQRGKFMTAALMMFGAVVVIDGRSKPLIQTHPIASIVLVPLVSMFAMWTGTLRNIVEVSPDLSARAFFNYTSQAPKNG